MKKLRKAVLPVAGLGTRFLPATKAMAKEMLPVVDKPLIQYAVEEAYAAGVREMIFVTGRHKRPIEDHFDMTFELEVALEQAGKQELLDVVRSVKPDDMDCIYVRQAQALGLGHAVLCARAFLSDAPFLLTYGDIMLDAANYGKFVGSDPAVNLLALNWVDDPWAGAAVTVDDQNRLLRIQEKPPRGTATTHWNNAGLFRLDPVIFNYLAALKPSARNEYELPDAISAMMQDGHLFQGVPLEGAWRDVGTLDDYAAINAEFEARD